jgi:hypothetical protein
MEMKRRKGVAIDEVYANGSICERVGELSRYSEQLTPG